MAPRHRPLSLADTAPRSARSDATRARIVGSTINLLGEKGYAAATMKAIAAAAECSVGAVQHQFASKALLMASVLEELLDKRIAVYRRDLAATPIERGVDSLVAGTWSVARQPAFLATVEIALARRSDEELRQATERSFTRAERLFERWTRRLWTRYGMEPLVAANARRLHSAFMTGVAIRLASGLERDADSLLGPWGRVVQFFAANAELRDSLAAKDEGPSGDG